MPGAFNALCAKAIADAGFPAAYISGAATSVSAGVPDVGLLTLEHFARAIREAHDASGLPIIADADTGFGESEMVRRTVLEYARAGAAGLHIEDQVFPKRCGHLDGKKLVPLDHAVEKIRAAVKAARDGDAKWQSGKVAEWRSAQAIGNGASSPTLPLSHSATPPLGFIVCARTDARSVEGLDAVISRARAYVQAGADMIFPEGLQSEDEFRRVADALRPAGSGGVRTGPYLLANMTEFGKTPIIPAARFGQMGYSCVIFPVTLLRVAMGAVTRALHALAADGSAQSLLDSMQTREQLYKTIAYTPGVEWELPAR
jgi:methylisocitrate lyase